MQNSLLCQNGGFCPQSQESLQIHFVDGNHWVTSSSFKQEIVIYDSLYSGDLRFSLQSQLAIIHRPLVPPKGESGESDQKLVVRVANVQQQRGSRDCGLFAISFSLHPALGENPEHLVLEQNKMCPHLLTF